MNYTNFFRNFFVSLIASVLFLVLLPASVYAQDWIKLESTANGYDLYDVHAVDQERVWAVGATPTQSGGVIMKTINGGDTWESAVEHEESLPYKEFGFSVLTLWEDECNNVDEIKNKIWRFINE